jgi:DNA-binding Lrp family transcriptional regulator
MRTSLLGNALVMVAIASSSWCSSLHGQWRIGVEVGAARFWGASRENSRDHPSFRPYRPTTFGLGLERQSGRYVVGLQVQYAEASLALEGVKQAHTCWGQPDIFAYCEASDDNQLAEVVLDTIHNLPGVRSTETHLVVDM